MKTEIKPRYDILFSDLKNHLIGDFLVSRDFKIVMSKEGYYETWQLIKKEVETNRTYFSVGYDHDRTDSLESLAIVLNAAENNPNFEEMASFIITSFIESMKVNENFLDVIEAMNVANFNSQRIAKVRAAFDQHQKLKLPDRENNKSVRENPSSLTKQEGNRVFIVHGHNEELKEKVARTVERLKLSPIILHEQSNEGKTIIEKFEKHSNVSFAIVLLTYDDFGNTKSEKEGNKRARQNVVLELGYFLAKIGRQNVMPLYEEGVELPSDISGVLYTLIDESENWKLRLVKELKSAGFKVDANDIL